MRLMPLVLLALVVSAKADQDMDMGKNMEKWRNPPPSGIKPHYKTMKMKREGSAGKAPAQPVNSGPQR